MNSARSSNSAAATARVCRHLWNKLCVGKGAVAAVAVGALGYPASLSSRVRPYVRRGGTRGSSQLTLWDAKAAGVWGAMVRWARGGGEAFGGWGGTAALGATVSGSRNTFGRR